MDINHPEFLQERNLNIDAADYDRNIDAKLYKPSDKNKFNCHNSEDLWSTSIKYKIQWFPFLTIMEHTAKFIEKNNGLISSLLKEFYMFELRLNYGKEKLYFISIRFINCEK